MEKSFCFDVRDFGALGNGEANDSTPIQRAIDVCAQRGGIGSNLLAFYSIFFGGTAIVFNPSSTVSKTQPLIIKDLRGATKFLALHS